MDRARSGQRLSRVGRIRIAHGVVAGVEQVVEQSVDEAGRGRRHGVELLGHGALQRVGAAEVCGERAFVLGHGRPLRNGVGVDLHVELHAEGARADPQRLHRRAVVSARTVAPGGGSTTSASCHCRPGQLGGETAEERVGLAGRSALHLEHADLGCRHEA